MNERVERELMALLERYPAGAEEVSPLLPEGVFHLMVADSDLTDRSHQRKSTLCGAWLRSSELPPPCWGEGDEVGDRDPRFCPACTRGSPPARQGCPKRHRGGCWGRAVSGDGEGLAAGVFHLVSAHEVVPRGNLRPSYYALCGARVVTAEMSGYSKCPHGCQCEDSGRMACCPACVREALRLNWLAGVEAGEGSMVAARG